MSLCSDYEAGFVPFFPFNASSALCGERRGDPVPLFNIKFLFITYGIFNVLQIVKEKLFYCMKSNRFQSI